MLNLSLLTEVLNNLAIKIISMASSGRLWQTILTSNIFLGEGRAGEWVFNKSLNYFVCGMSIDSRLDAFYKAINCY